MLSTVVNIIAFEDEKEESNILGLIIIGAISALVVIVIFLAYNLKGEQRFKNKKL